LDFADSAMLPAPGEEPKACPPDPTRHANVVASLQAWRPRSLSAIVIALRIPTASETRDQLHLGTRVVHDASTGQE
jgi:hypothetical protein